MGCAALRLRTTAWNFQRAFPVIVDRGDTAAVVVVLMPHPPAVGDRFEYDGMQWVVRAKDQVRGAVALPALTRGKR